MEQIVIFSREHRKFSSVLPIAAFVSTGCLILFDSGLWAIEINYWTRINLVPAICTAILIISSVWFIKNASRIELAPIDRHQETMRTLVVKIFIFFTLILVIRQLSIWEYFMPWEKLPIVTLVITQVVYSEQSRLDSIGLRWWNWHNVRLAIAFIGLQLLLLTTGECLIYSFAYGFEVFGTIQFCTVCQWNWLWFVFNFFVVAFGEELFFRGYLYTKLKAFLRRNRLDGRYVILVSLTITNVLFGLFHFPWYTGNWLTGDFSFEWINFFKRFILTTALGVYLTCVFERTGSLSAPMLIHGLNNAMASVLTFALTDELLSVNITFDFSLGYFLLWFAIYCILALVAVQRLKAII